MGLPAREVLLETMAREVRVGAGVRPTARMGPPVRVRLLTCDVLLETMARVGPPALLKALERPPALVKARLGPPARVEARVGPPARVEARVGPPARVEESVGPPVRV